MKRFPKILLSNVQSLMSKFDEFCLVLQMKRPQIVCLTETWLCDEIDDALLYIPNYNIVRNDRKGRRGGGTAIYVHKEFSFSVKDPGCWLNESADSTLITLTSLKLLILCVYIPPGLPSSTLESVRNDTVEMVDRCLNEDSSLNTIIVGDFNHFDVNILTVDLHLCDIVNKATRGNNVLDHILISHELQLYYKHSSVSYEAPIGRSDHLTLIATPEHVMQQRYQNIRIHRVFDYRQSNIETLLQQARLMRWEEIGSEGDDLDTHWRKLRLAIGELIDKSIPQKTVQLTSTDKEWMTPIAKLLIN